ncbi:MAG: zinc ribbon domain-containing protein [Planctomycetes bacterium]|nr:zinc ribbon domain-containing protein [Planctomycetota bacterium]
MALIKCTGCGQEIPDTATACLKCGAPVKPLSLTEAGTKGQSLYDKRIYLAALLSFVLVALSVVGLVIVVISTIAQVSKAGEITPFAVTDIDIIGMIVNSLNYIVGMLVIIFGWLRIGRLTKLGFLTVMSYIGIVTCVLLIPAELLRLLADPNVELIRGLGIAFIMGIQMLIFGISVLPLKRWFGGIATAVAIVNIATGACFITVICSPIGFIGLIVMTVVEIILLFKASKKLAVTGEKE